MKNVLAITAHPDDDTLFAGTLIKLKKSGWRLYEAILTGGENGVSIKKGVKNLKDQRKSEAENFAKEIGIEKIYWIGGTDGFLSNNKKILQNLLKAIREVHPLIVILLNPDDYHKDHQKSYKIGLDTVELASRHSYTEFGEAIGTPLILISDGLNLLPHPDIIVDISDVYKDKKKALETCYESQFDKDLIQFSQGLSSTRGARVKVSHAEAFNIGKTPSRPMLSGENLQALSDIIASEDP